MERYWMACLTTPTAPTEPTDNITQPNDESISFIHSVIQYGFQFNMYISINLFYRLFLLLMAFQVRFGVPCSGYTWFWSHFVASAGCDYYTLHTYVHYTLHILQTSHSILFVLKDRSRPMLGLTATGPNRSSMRLVEIGW